ncbi:hypothetical protein COB21_00175 [Candidatus Aerophobetes bacterium]|uniref:Uncharacterized protein n=1 Tax=Aerophobetes bacterium TaxID=2030807 RepID=A0A2A4X9D0_UNCAE|nr:MAG: hypothetical protein COB21_00175 [Candidatus Aerophobetes bacterium]
MVRISKKDRKKHCPRKPKIGSIKTGPKKDNLPKGFKEHGNIYVAKTTYPTFVPKISGAR